jgi:uncharacterized protein (DUF58 family)
MIILELGFSLSVMAAISAFVLSVSSWMTEASVEPSRVRTFKHQQSSAQLTFRTRGSRWAHLNSIALRTPFGLEGSIKQLHSTSAELTLEPAYAGRFDRIVVKVSTTDVLGLYLREEEVPLPGFVVESLPLALLAEARPVPIFPLVVGENPAGRSGTGQELYSIEQYQPSLDTRDILWKRVARATDASIPVRIREANVRKTVSIGVAVECESEVERAKRMDLVFEAIAQVGTKLLLARTVVDVLLLEEGLTFGARASSLAGLADATAGAWRRVGDGNLQSLIRSSDMIIVGPKELNASVRLLLSSAMPILLVSEQPLTSGAQRATSIFTGVEDLTALAVAVLER